MKAHIPPAPSNAQILLHSHLGRKPAEIADWLDVATGTVYNTRQRYLDERLPGALYEKPRPGQPVKLDLRQEAAITVLACSDAPPGHALDRATAHRPRCQS
ncbi:MAG: helix-turn-helix domain-containing protein [Anaerolineae bacterium]|nr:MAG: helix-turn-helix domain-containing protein [Anaerolineae bacterium]